MIADGASGLAGPLGLLSDGGVLAGSPSGNGNIYHFGTDGALLDTFASGLGQVGGIAAVGSVPEPGTLGLAAGGLVAGALSLHRRWWASGLQASAAPKPSMSSAALRR